MIFIWKIAGFLKGQVGSGKLEYFLMGFFIGGFERMGILGIFDFL
jgi:hypothetical protein